MKRPALLLAAILLCSCTAAPPAKSAKSAPQKSGTPRADAYGYLIKTAKGRCLQHDAAKHTLSAAACAPRDTQHFAITGNRIRVNGLCMQAQPDKNARNAKSAAKTVKPAAKPTAQHATVAVARCTGHGSQSWYRDGQTIRSSLNGLCLEAGKGGSIGLAACNRKPAQQFGFSQK